MATKELTRTKEAEPPPASSGHTFWPARDPFSFLQTEIDRLFDNFSGANFRRPIGMQEFWPRLEVKESDGLIEVAAELPGMDEKDIEVNVTDSQLTIRGEKKSEKDEKTKSYRLVERSYGTFERSVALPAGVDASKVRANMRKGVLHVEIPRPASSKGKRVEISAT